MLTPCNFDRFPASGLSTRDLVDSCHWLNIEHEMWRLLTKMFDEAIDYYTYSFNLQGKWKNLVLWCLLRQWMSDSCLLSCQRASVISAVCLHFCAKLAKLTMLPVVQSKFKNSLPLQRIRTGMNQSVLARLLHTLGCSVVEVAGSHTNRGWIPVTSSLRFSIVTSYLEYGHYITALQVLSLFLVFGALFFKSFLDALQVSQCLT